MSKQQIVESSPFQEAMHRLYTSLPNKGLLGEMRAKAWSHYLSSGLSTHSWKGLRSTPLKKILNTPYSCPGKNPFDETAFQQAILPECQNSTLLFVNSHFRKDLSKRSSLPDQVITTSLDDATKTFGSFLQNQWEQSLKAETNPFTLLNTAVHEEGLFFYVPPNCICKEPVQILQVIDSTHSPSLAHPRVQLFVGKGAEVTLAVKAVGLKKGAALNSVFDLSIEEGAHVTVFLDAHNEKQAWNFTSLRATLKRNSHLTVVHATDGSQTTRHDYQIFLTGEGSHANLSGIANLDEKREAHTQVLIEHQAPHCQSNQLFKNLLSGTSRSSFEGKIHVHQIAQKTEAYQLNQNLLLSDAARADSKPNLEIFADDVKASHGSTFGEIDNDQLLYLMTRGLSRKQAEKMLTFGFSKEVFDPVTIPSLKELWLKPSYDNLKKHD